MRRNTRLRNTIALATIAVLSLLTMSLTIIGQRGGQQAQNTNLPDKPTAVAIPTMSAEVTGPGTMFNSTPSLPPGRDLAHYRYEAREYFVSGTANAKPYTTRIIVRKPS